MKIRLYYLWAAIAGVAGLIVLLGYFADIEILGPARRLLMQWSVILAAGALLLGLANLFSVHWQKISFQANGWTYSAVLIFFMTVTLALGIIFGPDFEVMILFFNYIQVPVETAMLALLAVSLIVAGFRLASQPRDPFSLVFIGTAVLVLVGSSPWLLSSDHFLAHAVGNLRAWISQVWASGGARGILLGVALGATATGLRVLLGADRPYGD